MKNTIYYIILCIISTIFFVYALYKKRDNKLIALYFFMAGYTYFLEYFVLILFKGYSYYPKILKNEYFDNIAGAIVSDAFVIPMISTFIAAFKLNFKKRLFIAILITIIEIIFVRIKIYELHWWKHFYTFAGAIITFTFAQRLLSILQKTINHTTRYVTLFFANLYIQASIAFILVSILNLYFYNIQWFNNPFRSHVAFATLYIIFITVIFVSLVVFHLNRFWIGVGLLLPSITDIFLLTMNILIMSSKWSLISFLFFRILILICIKLFDKYFLTIS
jgi:hypothetical protein